VQPSELRVALFSGNYNYVRDGANQALNRLVEYLLRQGVHVRVYSPTVENPAFPATGDVVDIPALPIPGRSEYRLPIALPARVRRDLAEFKRERKKSNNSIESPLFSPIASETDLREFIHCHGPSCFGARRSA